MRVVTRRLIGERARVRSVATVVHRFAAALVATAWAQLHENSSTVSFSPLYPDDALHIASFTFEMPCPYDLGAPKAYMERFEVEAEVAVLAFAGFEFSYVATYPAMIDVEFLNACMHLQIHDIVVEETPIEPAGAPPFDWPELIRTGYVYAY